MTPADAAEDAAEGLRSLNHLTLATPSPGVPGWEDIGDIYQVLGALRLLADRLPQAYDQLAVGLQRLGTRTAWRRDDGSDAHADELAATAVEALQVAGCIAAQIGGHLQMAHGAVAHLYQ